MKPLNYEQACHELSHAWAWLLLANVSCTVGRACDVGAGEPDDHDPVCVPDELDAETVKHILATTVAGPLGQMCFEQPDISIERIIRLATDPKFGLEVLKAHGASDFDVMLIEQAGGLGSITAKDKMVFHAICQRIREGHPHIKQVAQAHSPVKLTIN